MVKVIMILVVALLGSVVGAKVAFEAKTAPGPGPVNQPWALDTMQFVAWNDVRWTAWIRAGEFEQKPAVEGRWNRHASRSIAFIDWDGQPWQARVEGDEFLLASKGDWNGPIERADALRYRDWEGKNRLRTVAQLRR